MSYVLVAALAAAAVVGGIRSLAGPSPTAVAEPPAREEPEPPAPRAAAPTPDDEDPHAGLAPGAADGDPHARASQSDVTVKPVERAPGPNGRTVAEVIAQRGKLAGKTVRIHATVVKSTPGVLGKTWLHLRDGSGAEGTNDITVTTAATPAVGDTVVVEGVVALDRDVGSGYRFPTLVEDAKVITP